MLRDVHTGERLHDHRDRRTEILRRHRENTKGRMIKRHLPGTEVEVPLASSLPPGPLEDIGPSLDFAGRSAIDKKTNS